MIRSLGCALLLAGAVTPAGRAAAQMAPVVVDDFESVSAWSAHPADGVELAIRSDAGDHGHAMRLDFKFLHGGGYAVAHRALSLDLPDNYAFSFRIRGEAPSNHLEFKLIDDSSENVWWSVRRDVSFPAQWETFTIKKRQISFAWGPAGGGEIKHVAALEFAVTAGKGGTGSVWIDDLQLRPLPPPGSTFPPPLASASSQAPGYPAAAAADGDTATAWQCATADATPSLTLDLGGEREYGGLVVDWAAGRHPPDYDVEASGDGTAWRTLREVRGSNGGRDYVYAPESESRYVRVRARRVAAEGAGQPAIAMRELRLQPLAWSATREAFFQAIAQDALRGSYPRGMSGEQVYWTIVGTESGAPQGLLSEDGMLETGKGALSIEPFLYVGGRLVTWGDAQIEPSLDSGFLPVPSVRWSVGDLSLTITAFAAGDPSLSRLSARYRIANHGQVSALVTLYLALRPFQVNPPAQFLNMPGGTARVRSISSRAYAGGRIWRATLDGTLLFEAAACSAAFGAVPFDAGDIVTDYLRAGRLPPNGSVDDPFEAASGALAFPLDLAPGAQHDVDVQIPRPGVAAVPIPEPGDGDQAVRTALTESEEQLQRCHAEWQSRLSRVTIQLPDSSAAVVQSLRAQLAWILAGRVGPALQPGTRSYARSWIRDGALTCSALLRLGESEPVRAFLEWYAPNQYPNGKIPCVVDARGADPVPEHDSSGEFIYLVAELYRYTGDRTLMATMFPRVRKAAAYLDSLRQTRRSDEYRTADKREFFGLLPPSISHEGYSAKPMHSYWDDFWALRGFKDAAFLAGELGRKGDRARLEAICKQFEHDLAASVDAAMKRHAIDYVPGCADLGDFDATSTTIALAPAGAGGVLPRAAVERTFQKYYEFFRDRRAGTAWEAFTPYEIRTIGAFVRLGWRERANEALDFFLGYQRPTGWRQWPEVVWHDARAPHFLGDLPHTWVGSDYIRSVLDMLAYEREEDDALVIGAGVPLAWLHPAPGLVVRGLGTRYGTLSYTMQSADTVVQVRIEGGLRVPAGGIIVRPPLPWPVRAALVNGKSVKPSTAGEIVVSAVPATVLLRH